MRACCAQGLGRRGLKSSLPRDAFFRFSFRRTFRSDRSPLSLSFVKTLPSPTVIATLGPACRDVETLKDMLEAGMSCARVDLTVSR